MWKVFVPVAIVVVAIAVGIGWMVRHHDNPPSAHHDEHCPPTHARVPRPPAAPAHVSGHVTKKSGGAIAGATVALVQTGLDTDFSVGDQSTLFAITDESGAWTLENVPPGDYVASATAKEFLPANHTKFAIAPGDHHAGIEMSLEAGGTPVRGAVSDLDGKPIVGVRIEVVESMRSETEVRAPYLAVTGPDGKYELSLSDGRHWFTVRHDDFAIANRSVEVADKPQSVDFKLVRGGTIHGLVFARATGKPVPGAIVDGSTDILSHSHWRGEAIADDDGKFVLHGVPHGVVSLDAYAAGGASAQPIRVGIGMGEQVDGVRLAVDPALSICGRVVDKGKRAAIADATVYAASLGAVAMPRAPDPSGSDGAFQIVGVRRGIYRLFAHAENELPAERDQVQVGDGDLTGVIVEMEAGVTLTGRITPPGKASISLMPQGERRAWNPSLMYVGTARSDTSGAWTLKHVPPGKYMVVASTIEGAAGTLQIVVADRDQKDLAVTLEKRASVSGRVIDTKGAPVAGLKLQAWPDARTRAHQTADDLDLQATSDATGAFKIVGLQPGAYHIASGEIADRLMAALERKKPPDPIEVVAGAELTNVVVTVEPRDGVIRGVVTIAGKPIRGVWVTARLQQPDGSLSPGDMTDSEPVLSDANGNFAIDHLLARTYTLVAEGPRAASRGEKAGVKTGDIISIELQSVGTLTGHVTLDGKPVTSYDVRCRRGSNIESTDLHVEAADGAYTLDHLAAGQYACGVSTMAGNGAGVVEVPAGAATLDLALVPWATITGQAVNALNGAPVSQAYGNAYSASGADDQEAARAVYGGDTRTQSDASGRFKIEHVANGPGYVSLWHRSVAWPIGHKPYTVTAGQRLDIGTVLVVPPRTGDPGTLGMDVKPGSDTIEVTSVTADGPASRAGIVPGDKITAIQGHTITELTPDTAKKLFPNFAAIAAGQTVAFTLARGTTVSVTAAKL